METGLRVARRRSCLSSVQLVLLTFAIFLQGTIGQLVDVEPSQATLTEGDSINLLCRSGNPLNYCRFVIPGESNVVVLSEQWPPKVPGYKYHGQGTHAGQCGVTIERVSARNHGKVKCYLGFQGDELSGTIDLVVALPPRRPELEVVLAGQQTQRSRGNFYEANDDIEARCISRDGRPPANITWFLNDEPITEGLAAPVVVESTGNGNTTNLYSVYQILRRRIAPTDDGKFLVCRTSHIADRGQDNSVKQQMIVRFAPMPQDPVTVYGVTLSRTALINVTVQANPRPRVEWTANGVVVTQGQQNGRYEAYEPTDFGNGLYNVVLSIDSITLEDTTKDYYLRASNELGQTEYIVRISSSTTPAASGLDTGAIIGIVVAVAVLLIVVILIIFARATGRWCFEAKSSQPATSETSDTESAQLKSTKFGRLSLPKFPIVFKKKNANQQTGEDVNQNEGQNEDEQRLASVTIDANTGGDNQDTREDKQLVYAELVLKPADDKPNLGQKDSTEYAEIIHVQKPTGNEQPPNIGPK